MFLNSVSWVEISGTTYHRGDVVVTDTDLVPVFGVVEDIIVDSMQCHYLVCEVLSTICFVRHFHSYEVATQSPTVYYICKPTSLFDNTVLGRYQLASHPSFFVPLKYHLVEHL